MTDAACFVGFSILSTRFCSQPVDFLGMRRKSNTALYRTSSDLRRSILMETSPHEPISYPQDFDRDYYGELKREFAGIDGVEIFSKDDYEIDEDLAPWLDIDLDSKVKDIQQSIENRPVDLQDINDVSKPIMRLTDVHTAEEIKDFESALRLGDSVSGRAWEDPMPESDFGRDPEWIDFRKIHKSTLNDDNEAFLGGLEHMPMRRKLYDTPEEEWHAVKESVDRMQAENLDQEVTYTAWGECIPSPDPKDLDKWRRAAIERGGNAVQNESYFLSPVTVRQPIAESTLVESMMKSHSGKLEIREPPRQYQELYATHGGQWRGQATVFSIHSDNDISLRLERELELQTETFVSDENLVWTSSVADDASELMSECKLRFPKYRESLMSGRAVCTGGGYVMATSPDEDIEQGSETGDITVGIRFLSRLTEDSTVDGALEICLLSTNNSECVTRDRVILCIASGLEHSGQKPGKGGAMFRYIVWLTEQRESEARDRTKSLRLLLSQQKELCNFARLTGVWAGTGELLHPEFPMVPYRKVDTKYNFFFAKNITEKDVTWIEKLPDEPGAASQARARTLGKKKISKRVKAARDYDRKRLERCSFLSHETIGTEGDIEAFAWQGVYSPEGFVCMFSPRTGRFADDYGGVVLNNQLLLSFPLSKAFPEMWNTVCLTNVKTPERQRINVGRNECGHVVGVLFVTESITNTQLCAEVSSSV